VQVKAVTSVTWVREYVLPESQAGGGRHEECGEVEAKAWVVAAEGGGCCCCCGGGGGGKEEEMV